MCMMGVDMSPALASLATGKNHYYDRFFLAIRSLVFPVYGGRMLIGC